MAKLGLLFIAIFCAVQLSMAARIAREADTPQPSSDADTLAQNFKDKLSAAGDSIRGLFTQENLDKAVATLKETGEKIRVGAVEFGESASKTFQSAVDNIKDQADKQTS